MRGIVGLPAARLAALTRIGVPKKVVFGVEDDVFSCSSPYETAKLIGVPTPTIIPGARHLSFISHPDQVAAAIRPRRRRVGDPSRGRRVLAFVFVFHPHRQSPTAQHLNVPAVRKRPEREEFQAASYARAQHCATETTINTTRRHRPLHLFPQEARLRLDNGLNSSNSWVNIPDRLKVRLCAQADNLSISTSGDRSFAGQANY
jgi:hypothetical protein